MEKKQGSVKAAGDIPRVVVQNLHEILEVEGHIDPAFFIDCGI
jgi:hypothetical protein